MDYKEYLKFYPDFPVPGVNFVDIIPLMQDKALFRSLITDLGALCASPNILAPEARGFLFGAPMLIGTDNIQRMIPLRKKGKLPHAEGDLICVDIIKEYGKDQVFYRRSDLVACIAEDGFINVTFFDDVPAAAEAEPLALAPAPPAPLPEPALPEPADEPPHAARHSAAETARATTAHDLFLTMITSLYSFVQHIYCLLCMYPVID